MTAQLANPTPKKAGIPLGAALRPGYSPSRVAP